MMLEKKKKAIKVQLMEIVDITPKCKNRCYKIHDIEIVDW